MIVGLGGNNGTTVVASVIANRRELSWHHRSKMINANYYGSITQSSTFRIGYTEDGLDHFVPFSSLLPMINPNDFVFGGWDINRMNLGDAMRRADVLPWELQEMLYKDMKNIIPLPSCYDPDFIASNQEERANHIIPGTKKDCLDKIRQDIRDFKEGNQLDKVIVV